ncbi:nicotinamide riboside transporter PnuC [uncultured Clostridium sp.]|uniref:nicotinamide riboside transporter PnuC n=1 Tax=uncultured Clostridium sp. TaxID=59620 RepID=UPI00261DD169|nr:nicotinamide riboside transporter PnuC [uncultured Clostridium sp.]
MNFFKSFSKFHKIYFVVFLVLNVVLFFTPAVLNGENIFTLVSILGFVSTIAGLFAAIYTARASVVCYIWGFFNAAAYACVSYFSHVYGQVILYVLFQIPMQFVGFYLWNKSLKQGDTGEIEVRRMNAKNWITLAIFFIVVWILYGILLKQLPNIFEALFNVHIDPDKQFIIDSLTSTLMICAVITSIKRYVEQWYFWILTDAVGIVLFVLSLISAKHFSFNSLSGAIMWIQFTLNGIYGFVNWKRLNKK